MASVDMLQLRVLQEELKHLEIRKQVKPDDNRDIEPVLSYLNDRIDELGSLVNS